jgi:hypothetical protein
MSKSLIYAPGQWIRLKTAVEADHGRTIFLIRDKTIRTLGFSVRHHLAYILRDDTTSHHSPGYYQDQVHLDFVNDMYKTMFLLKYGSENVQARD